jgi:hypothetical protein
MQGESLYLLVVFRAAHGRVALKVKRINQHIKGTSRTWLTSVTEKPVVAAPILRTPMQSSAKNVNSVIRDLRLLLTLDISLSYRHLSSHYQASPSTSPHHLPSL